MAEWLIKWDEGQAGVFTPLGFSLWFGRSIAESKAACEPLATFPAEWIENAKHRAREALPHLHIDNTASNNDIVEILRYWADKDLAADILEVEDGVLLVDR